MQSRVHRAIPRSWLIAALIAAIVGASLMLPAPSSAHEPHDDTAYADWPIPDDTPLKVKFKWSGPVTFCVDTTLLPQGVTAAAFTGWVRHGMDAWNATRANVELRLSGPCTGPAARANGVNEVGFEAFDQGVTAVGFAYTRSMNGNPIEGDVSLRLDWDTSAVCRINTLVHEFGHILGFTHSEHRSEVMGYGPCSVIVPSDAEVELLVQAYGQRASQVSVANTPPPEATNLALTGVQVAHGQQSGAHYYTHRVTIAEGTALVLRPLECLTIAGRTDPECIEESTQSGYWYSQSGLSDVSATAGQQNVVPASQFGHLARPLAPCNTTGCGTPFDVRAGAVRAAGTGIDFAYFAHATPGGQVSIQLLNRSFYLPPTFLDVASSFEVRIRGVAGSVGLVGTCSLKLGQACQLTAVAGQPLEFIAVGNNGSRTGVWVAGLTGAAASQPSQPSGPLVTGGLPTRGVAIVLWNGGPVTNAAADPKIVSIFVTQGGVMRGYVIGAPSVVNAGFLGAIGSELPANTPVIVIVRS